GVLRLPFSPLRGVCCCRSFFFSSRRRHTRFSRDWSSDVCSSDLPAGNLRCSTLSNAALLCSLILFTICWKRCNCERNCIFVIRSAFAAISSACSLGNGRAFCCCFLASDGFLTVCVLGFMACLSFFCSAGLKAPVPALPPFSCISK